MSRSTLFKLAPAALFAVAAAVAPSAYAADQLVTFNVLNASATLPTPFLNGDSLHLNTYVTTETGALTQSITFTLGAGIASVTGQSVWEVNPAAGSGPRMTGVNIDIFNAANVLVASDTFAGLLGNFAVSTFSSAIGPGTYHVVVTGTGVRESSLDLTLNFASAVPEPGTYGLMLAGVGLMALVARRRRVS